MLSVSAYLVNGDVLDMGSVAHARLLELQRDGREGRELIDALITDDWGAPPRYVELTGRDADGNPLRLVIQYD